MWRQGPVTIMQATCAHDALPSPAGNDVDQVSCMGTDRKKYKVCEWPEGLEVISVKLLCDKSIQKAMDAHSKQSTWEFFFSGRSSRPCACGHSWTKVRGRYLT